MWGSREGRGVPVGQGSGVGREDAISYDAQGGEGDLTHVGQVLFIDEQHLQRERDDVNGNSYYVPILFIYCTVSHSLMHILYTNTYVHTQRIFQINLYTPLSVHSLQHTRSKHKPAFAWQRVSLVTRLA